MNREQTLKFFPRLKAIESFSGAGGMSLGLIDAGYDVRLAFDKNKAAIQTHNSNLGGHGHVLDATQVSGEELLELANLRRGELDLFSGGPPCQGFSKQRRGAHLLHDDRNKLVLEYARLVEETETRSFIFENVEIFGQKRGGDLIAEVREQLSTYSIFTFFICSSNFGLAQKRGRFIMLGIHKDISTRVPILRFSDEYKTIKDVIGYLPPPPDDYSEHPHYPNHLKCRITEINEKRFSHVQPGGGWQDIPWELRLPCHKAANPQTGGWPDVYGRLEWDKQCPTLTAGFDSFTRGRYGHPEQNRSLTLREGALLQGFPEQFRFIGTRADVRLQIGNAVPPPVAKAAGEALAKVLTGRNDDLYIVDNCQEPEETPLGARQCLLAI